MRTNIVIDDKLIQRAMRATGLPTKRAVVEAGLQLLIQIKAQTGIRRLKNNRLPDCNFLPDEQPSSSAQRP